MKTMLLTVTLCLPGNPSAGLRMHCNMYIPLNLIYLDIIDDIFIILISTVFYMQCLNEERLAFPV